jgi:sensor histidine kinase YesM
MAAATLKTQLARAELGLLKMQLQPHFLFNTLNAISEQVHADPEAAEQMITHLSELLRHTIGSAEAQEISLGEELALLERYLDIQRARFAGRLEVTLDVDVGAMESLVPNLILQPLVENAIRHGIAPRANGGHVAILVRRQIGSGRLSLEVRDDGIGLDAARARSHDGAERERVGIANTVARLRQLYGEDYTFTLKSGPAGGAVASVTLPLHDTAISHGTASSRAAVAPNGEVVDGT